MTASTVTVACARCSRVTTDPKRDNWSMRPDPLVVQGVTLGLCGHCAAGSEPPAEGAEKSCEGSCQGNYRPARGTYFLAEWGDTFSGGETWACWDLACVQTWLDEQPYDCSHCGSTVDMDVFEVTDGKRKRVAS